MRPPEVFLQSTAFQYLPVSLKTNCTKISNALTGPISSISTDVAVLSHGSPPYGKSRGDLITEGNQIDWSKAPEDTMHLWPPLSEGSSTIYKDFGNGLSFCNTNLPDRHGCLCPYEDFISSTDDFDKNIVSEDVLMEFIQDLNLSENQLPSELNSEMVDLGDLSDFLENLGQDRY